MLTFKKFWWECCKDAFRKSWALGGIVNFALSILVVFAPLLDPHADKHKDQWGWVNAYFVAMGTLGVAWLALFARLLIWAPYQEYKKEAEARQKKQLENESLKDIKGTESRARKERVLNEACDAIRSGAASILAVQIAKADELQGNEELVWLCDQLVSYGKQHPFESVLDLEPAANYLFILQAIRRSGAVIRYSEDLPGFLLYVKRPSLTPDTGASPQEPAS